ncbi:hypothetical protein DFH11DRAFT_1565511 [Phellopilus nigrolimitatus]|nr:hypothetical protein DFH11DRAFT_1565511 [Phellopilus nigrolimitatus]
MYSTLPCACGIRAQKPLLDRMPKSALSAHVCLCVLVYTAIALLPAHMAARIWLLGCQFTNTTVLYPHGTFAPCSAQTPAWNAKAQIACPAGSSRSGGCGTGHALEYAEAVARSYSHKETQHADIFSARRGCCAAQGQLAYITTSTVISEILSY